jgi:chromosome partitioning protein
MEPPTNNLNTNRRKRHMTKTVTFGTLKGGTGKTMATFNIAGALANVHKVLLVDCDPQCNLTANVGMDVSDPTKPSIKDVFEKKDTSPCDVVCCAPTKELPTLDLIPSSLFLVEAEMGLVNRSGREQILGNWFKRNIDYFKKYDYIIFDTNPSMGLVNQNAFTMSESIILVTDIGFNSIMGAQAFVYLWAKRRDDMELDDNITALIINNSDKRIGLGEDLKEYINSQDDLSGLLVLPEIPARVALKRTEGSYTPISLSSPDSDAASNIRLLVENLKKKGAL